MIREKVVVETTRIGKEVEICEFCVVRPGVTIGGGHTTIRPNILIDAGGYWITLKYSPVLTLKKRNYSAISKNDVIARRSLPKQSPVLRVFQLKWGLPRRQKARTATRNDMAE